MDPQQPPAGINPIDSDQLRTFVAVERLGGFTASAKSLGLTQSAVSHLIKRLEKDLGCRLLDRTGGKVTLTRAGEVLKEHADRILASMAKARMDLQTQDDGGRVRIRVGAPDMIVSRVLPDAVRNWKAEALPGYPELISAREHEVTGLINGGQIDLGIAVMPSRGLDVPHRKLFKDELMLASLPWRPIESHGLHQETILLPAAETETGQLLRQWLKSSGVRASSLIEVGESATAKEMTARGLGVSFLAPWECEPELSRGQLALRPCGKRMITRTWIMFHRRGRDLTPTEERLCAAVVTKVSTLRKDRHDVPRRRAAP